MLARILLITLSFSTTHLLAQEQPQEESPGVVRQVTLYRDQARVTREIDIAAGPNDREIHVGRLPENIVPESVFAEGDEAIEIRSVRIVRRASADSNRAEVRELNEKIAKHAQDRERATRKLQLLNKKMEYIDQLMEFSSTSTQTDIQRGLLDANSLAELSNFSMEKQTELSDAQLELEQQLAVINEQESLLKRELSLLTQSSTTYPEASLQIASRDNLAGKIKLSYLVSGCGWEPQYTFRGETGKATVGIRYNALVQQMSGEDWKEVQLTLSTASLAATANSPALTPLRIQVTTAIDNSVQKGFANQSLTRRDPIQATESPLVNQSEPRDNFERDLELNSLANQLQDLELKADAEQLKTIASDATEEVASQNHLIAKSISLTSRQEQQLVQVFEAELAGKFYHVATPLLSSFAYREADLINTLDTGLLQGSATIYLDNRFVGRSQIPSIASGQHLIVGFGADQQVRTRRQLLEKSDDVQGGNRRMTFKYRLVVANFKHEPLELRLYDRLPFAGQSSDVAVQLSPPALPISKDGLYERIQKPSGILRWDLEVPAERFGEKAFDVEYSFSTEFERTRMLTTHQSTEQLESDYIELSTPSSGLGGGGMGGMGGGMMPSGNFGR